MDPIDTKNTQEFVDNNKFAIYGCKECDSHTREKSIWDVAPMDYKKGGSGYVLYLYAIRYFSLVFLIMSMIQFPILYAL